MSRRRRVPSGAQVGPTRASRVHPRFARTPRHRTRSWKEVRATESCFSFELCLHRGFYGIEPWRSCLTESNSISLNPSPKNVLHLDKRKFRRKRAHLLAFFLFLAPVRPLGRDGQAFRNLCS